MTQTELIKMEQIGQRIPRQPHSLFDAEMSIREHLHNWRTIVCDGDNDVLECSLCGKHRVDTCDFDEEYD